MRKMVMSARVIFFFSHPENADWEWRERWECFPQIASVTGFGFWEGVDVMVYNSLWHFKHLAWSYFMWLFYSLDTTRSIISIIWRAWWGNLSFITKTVSLGASGVKTQKSVKMHLPTFFPVSYFIREYLEQINLSKLHKKELYGEFLGAIMFGPNTNYM